MIFSIYLFENLYSDVHICILTKMDVTAFLENLKAQQEELKKQMDSIVAKHKEIKANQPKYRIMRQLGEGGSATVYLARTEDEKYVAVKQFVSRADFKDEQSRLQKIAEFDASTPGRSNVITLLDSYEEGPTGSIVIEAVGPSLQNLIDKGVKLTPDAVRKIQTDMLSALTFLHQKCDIVHKDIKPENICIKEYKYSGNDFATCEYVLIDFGGGRTINYIPPELANNTRQYRAATDDIWALGCVLFEVQALKPLMIVTPHLKGANKKRTYEKQLSQITSKVDAHILDDEIKKVIRRMLEVDVEHRFRL